MKNNINKRFPANTTLEDLTFLNDKKIDGELYALLQSLSIPNENKETVVYTSSLPSLAELCKKLGIKSRPTFKSHLKYLAEKGYIIIDEVKGQYILPNREEIYLMLPLETVMFLHDALHEQVVKIYIYLGQRWKYKQAGYQFTIAELGQHIGLSTAGCPRTCETINNALICLRNNGLIDYEEFTVGVKTYKKLTGFSTRVKK